ncbi:MAG TPA: response regulator transcription factor [Abditibacteriaceae bacterium]|jgi:DNA-binding NarL/FixJ family response regulator
MNVQLKFLIVDDHAVVRQGLKHILQEEWAGATFGEAPNVAAMLPIFRKEAWNVVLLDINMPGRSGLDVLRDLKTEKPNVPVLILSGHPEDQYAVRVLKAGASGYLPKETASDELIKAVRKVLDGGKYVSATLAEQIASGLGKESEKMPHESLSDREYQVMRLIAAGKTPTQIAAELMLSVKTISTFRTRVLAKMGRKTNADLIQYALQHNLLDS